MSLGAVQEAPPPDTAEVHRTAECHLKVIEPVTSAGNPDADNETALP
jgi:hypothetical protein